MSLPKTDSCWSGLDVGGANLKVFANGRAKSEPFQLWQSPEKLTHRLRDLDRDWSLGPQIAVTMTGELCDCFESKAAGVRHIVASCLEAFPEAMVRFYQTDGSLVSCEAANANWRLTAAANWHATASAIQFLIPDWSGILIDIGSTTCDLIPVVRGRVVAQGRSDFERMIHRELVYTGIERSPVSMVAHTAEWNGIQVQLAQEYFATMHDVYVVLGLIDARFDSCQTADGHPADRAHSLVRLARAFCSDSSEIGTESLESMAQQIADRQFGLVVNALEFLMAGFPESSGNFMIAGQGEWLGAAVAQKARPNAKLNCMSDFLAPGCSQAAAAWAVSELAHQNLGSSAVSHLSIETGTNK